MTEPGSWRSSALGQRTLTALVLAPLVVSGVLWLPTPVLGALLALLMLLAAWEWCDLAGLDRPPARVLGLGTAAAGLALFAWRPDWQPGLLAVAALWWAVQIPRLARIRHIKPATRPDWLLLPTGLVVLVAPWAALVQLHGQPGGPGLVFCLLALIWTADSMAYFVGRRWGAGRVRLAPVLSPGKTRVGVYGALAGAALCALGFAWLRDFDAMRTLPFLLLCGVTALISVVGDLHESLLKRRRGLKDSGRLLPGHGGLLDRIDSLTAAAPVFALGILLMGV